MERRGIYRKGSSGHVRNASTYRIYREHYKKWKLPVGAALVFLLVFSMAPIVGDTLQTSTFTNPELEALVEKNPTEARKALMNEVVNFIRLCQRFDLKACVDQGNDLLLKASDRSASLDALLTHTADLEVQFEETLMHNVCRFDVPQFETQLKKLASAVATAYEPFKDFDEVQYLSDLAEEMEAAQVDLRNMLEECGK